MKNLLIAFLAFVLINFSVSAQSFSNVDELLQLSEMDPLECEKTLTVKGFVFVETDGLKSEYRKSSEYLSYRVTPRRAHYKTTSRSFFLEVNSRLIKQGFVLVSSEGFLEDDGDKSPIKAQQYEKGKFTVWLFIRKDDYDDSKTYYHIQVDNSGPSSTKKTSVDKSKRSEFKYKGDKSKIDYGYFSVGLIIPRGVIAEDPKANTTLEQDFNGLSGIGAKVGFEFAVGGIVGFTPLNNRLPHPLDFGIIMNGHFGVQPYSYESLGGNYDNYDFAGFMKAGAGIGPAMILTPFRETDFHISLYYKMDAGINFDGGFKYTGSTNYEETLERDAISFAWVKSYGFHLYGANIFGGVEFSNYTDKGLFNLTQSYFDTGNNFVYNTQQIQAALPIKQITLKIGFTF